MAGAEAAGPGCRHVPHCQSKCGQECSLKKGTDEHLIEETKQVRLPRKRSCTMPRDEDVIQELGGIPRKSSPASSLNKSSVVGVRRNKHAE